MNEIKSRIPDEERRVAVNISLALGVIEELKRAAQQEGRSLSNLVNFILRQWLEERRKEEMK
jgi:metal-responsive CopG/Arc/MetJ family transcriptional regulator